MPLSTEMLKAIALKQFNNEDYFIIGDDVFEGTEDDAKEQFEEDEDSNISFDAWCLVNVSLVEELNGDDERDGYIVLTDEEADEKAAQYIKYSLWAFNASFICENTDLPYEAEEMIQAFQEAKCEGANDTIEALIKDMPAFIRAAISADGRGHFLNSYDGNENEETVEGETFYIYRS